MLSFFFFALGAVIGYWIRGTKLSSAIHNLLEKFENKE